MKEYTYKYGKKLRKGYTTGTAASAAAKAAIYALLHQKSVPKVSVTLPSDDSIEIDIASTIFEEQWAISTVHVDGGDDHNVLNGCSICAKVNYAKKYELTGGIGIGTVTCKGLQVEIGKKAINPVPKKMIQKAIEEEYPSGNIKVEIFVPEGESLAKKTLNQKIGIVDGISILGTTGIVEPMSNKGYIDSMYTEISSMLDKSHDIVIVSGNYGYSYAKDILKIEEKKIVKVSNFVGEALFYLRNTKVENILMIGHAGKFVKIAGGIFNTHSYVADAKMEIIAATVLQCTKDSEVALQVLECKTTDEVNEILTRKDADKVYQRLCEKAIERIEETIKLENVKIEFAMFNTAKEILGKSKQFYEMVEKING